MLVVLPVLVVVVLLETLGVPFGTQVGGLVLCLGASSYVWLKWVPMVPK